jgi:predicted O-methyltransferase YrrM
VSRRETSDGRGISARRSAFLPGESWIRNASPVSDNQELLTAVRQARRSLATGGPDHPRSEWDFACVSLPEVDGDALRDLIVIEGAPVVVEVGLAYGSSALAIEEALVSLNLPDHTHLIIDAYQEQFGNDGWTAITAAGLAEFCALLTERSQLALPRLVSEGFSADAAFVDGSHVFHNVFVDLYFLRELVRPGGLVVLDDCQWPSVAAAVHYFEVNAGWRAEPVPEATRLRAFRLPDPFYEPRFDAFASFGSSGRPQIT